MKIKSVHFFVAFVTCVLITTSCTKIRVNEVYESADGASGRVIDVRNEDEIVEIKWFTCVGGSNVIGDRTSKMDMSIFKKEFKLKK